MIKKRCAVCNGKTELIFQFENFPSGARLYQSEDYTDFEDGQELKLAGCKSCGHLQLDNFYIRSFYDDTYSYRSSNSCLEGQSGYFLEALNQVNDLVLEHDIKSVAEIGANNLSFLRHVACASDDFRKFAIDPILKSDAIEEDAISLVPSFVEDVGVEFFCDVDLIISRHNLEHIEHPSQFLEKISKAAASAGSAKYVFVELPDVESMIKNNRIDNVFLEHMHYFSQSTITTLFHKNGFSAIKLWKNERYGGSICGIFKTSQKKVIEKTLVDVDGLRSQLIDSYRAFNQRCEQLRIFLEEHYGNCYGYGAGHSSPFLAYHIDGRFHLLEGIIDDDPNKIGKKISGIAPPIISFDSVPEDAKFLLVATDYSEQIVSKLAGRHKYVGLIGNV